MNHYHSHPGPTKSKAISMKMKSQTFPNNIKKQYNLQNTNNNVLKKILSDTIIHSVNDIYNGKNECPGSSTGYGMFVSKKIDNKIEETLPSFVKQYIKKLMQKNSAEQILASGIKITSNNPKNINVVKSIGTRHLTRGTNPHLEILKRREAKINKMIQNEHNRGKIIQKIHTLKEYYNNKKPDNYNIQKALNKFKRDGYNITGGGKSKKYIQLQSGGKRLVHVGKRGGKYYIKGGNKIYI